MLTDEQVEEQIARCRRIASSMTDDDIRHALEQLAEEYEALLLPRRRSFMLGDRPADPEPMPGPSAGAHRA